MLIKLVSGTYINVEYVEGIGPEQVYMASGESNSIVGGDKERIINAMSYLFGSKFGENMPTYWI